MEGMAAACLFLLGITHGGAQLLCLLVTVPHEAPQARIPSPPIPDLQKDEKSSYTTEFSMAYCAPINKQSSSQGRHNSLSYSFILDWSFFEWTNFEKATSILCLNYPQMRIIALVFKTNKEIANEHVWCQHCGSCVQSQHSEGRGRSIAEVKPSLAP